MQSLQSAIESSSATDRCARELIDTVPLVMRVIRMYMRGHRSGLTVPQFRTLCYVDSTEGSSLSGVADFIGLSLPAMSRLVDGLVDKRLMKRKTGDDDRRLIRLSVTPAGQTALREARALAQARLAKIVGQLTAEQQETLTNSMELLRDIFTQELSGQDDDSAV
jgi:DNA-binding MarR family transcriptional regulator